MALNLAPSIITLFSAERLHGIFELKALCQALCQMSPCLWVSVQASSCQMETYTELSCGSQDKVYVCKTEIFQEWRSGLPSLCSDI